MDLENCNLQSLPLHVLVQCLKRNSNRSKKTKLKTIIYAENYLTKVILSNLGQRISLYEILQNMEDLVQFLSESINMINHLYEYQHMHITEIVPNFKRSLTNLVLYLIRSANGESEVLFRFTRRILQCFIEVSTENPTLWFYITVISDPIRCILLSYDQALSGTEKIFLRSMLSNFMCTVPSPLLLCGDYCCQYLLVQLLHCFLNLQPELTEENEQILNNIFPDFIRQNYHLLLTENQFQSFSFLNILNSTSNCERLILSVPALNLFIGENVVKSPFEDLGYRFCVNFSYKSKRMHFFVITPENQADDVNINFNQIESVCVYKSDINIPQLHDAYIFHIHLSVDLIDITESLADVVENCRSLYVVVEDYNGINEVIHKLKYPVHKYQDNFCQYPQALLTLYLNHLNQQQHNNNTTPTTTQHSLECNYHSDHESRMESLHAELEMENETDRSNFSDTFNGKTSNEINYDANNEVSFEAEYSVHYESLEFETGRSNVSKTFNTRTSNETNHDANNEVSFEAEHLANDESLEFETGRSNVSKTFNTRTSNEINYDANNEVSFEVEHSAHDESLEFETGRSNVSKTFNAKTSNEINYDANNEASFEDEHSVHDESLEFETGRSNVSKTFNIRTSNELNYDANNEVSFEAEHSAYDESLEFETGRSNASKTFNAKTSNEVNYDANNEVSFEAEHSVHDESLVETGRSNVSKTYRAKTSNEINFDAIISEVSFESEHSVHYDYELIREVVNDDNPHTVALESLCENVVVSRTEKVQITLQSDLHSKNIRESLKTVESRHEDRFPVSLRHSNSLIYDLPRHTSTPISSPTIYKRTQKILTRTPCYKRLIPDDKENLDSSDPYALPQFFNNVTKTYKKPKQAYRKPNNCIPKEKRKRVVSRKQPQCIQSEVSPEYPVVSMLNSLSHTSEINPPNQKKVKSFGKTSVNVSKQATIDLLSSPVRRQFEKMCEDAKEELNTIFLSADCDEEKVLIKKDLNLNFGVNSKSALNCIRLSLVGRKKARKR